MLVKWLFFESVVFYVNVRPYFHGGHAVMRAYILALSHCRGRAIAGCKRVFVCCQHELNRLLSVRTE